MSSRYKVRSDVYIHRKVAESDILIPIGQSIANFNGYVELNPTASLLWDAMIAGKTEEELTAELIKTFDIPEETALEDTREFIQNLLAHDMVHMI